MNVTVESLGPCRKLVRCEIDAQAVDKAFEEVGKEVQREVRLPGFRPGKAPMSMVLNTYEKHVADEVKKKLMSTGYRDAIKEQKLNVFSVIDVEEIQFARSQPLQFAATVDIVPDFTLPTYRGLPARSQAGYVTPADIDRAVNALRAQRANYNKVEREARDGDIVVVNYTGTCEGKPIREIAPTAKGLNESKGFWIDIKPGSFIPGFSEQLTGARAGDRRTVTVDFPADFVAAQLAGKRGEFAVEVVEVKERVIPEASDELAKSFGAANLEALRDGVRRDLQNELNMHQKRAIRGQLVQNLLSQAQFELPETAVEQETRNVVYEIVSENQRRGVTKELIEQQKNEIYASANTTAKDRVRIALLFKNIAEKEGIQITEEDVNARIVALAKSYDMRPDEFVKKLQEREGLNEVVQQLVHEKVMNFLHENARIEDAPAPGGAG